MRKRIILMGIVCVCLTLLVITPGMAAQHTQSSVINNTTTPLVYSQEEFELRTTMDSLWTEHVVWTRMYIVSSLENAPDTNATAARLLSNQEDIGDAIKPFYGEEAGDNLTALLKEHILIAVDIIEAVKAENTSQVDADSARWNQNADDIAAFLADANPNFEESAIQEALYMHLAMTNDEVVARVNGNYTADIEAYDEIYDQILVLSDTLSDGIVQQFPERFGK
ncbi:glycosyltransferase [Methanoculleus sp. CWC-02]|uniref:Glycosyltransferase n=2 Tax=Methanoculleus oceani TaxID=2184756 RepID=A0ABD4T9M9_9EURY|nr:glycosyltransferase [Methanoculleus sp. CWC-02]